MMQITSTDHWIDRLMFIHAFITALTGVRLNTTDHCIY